MKVFFVLLFISFSIAALFLDTSFKTHVGFSDSDYSRYTCETFAKMEAASQEINIHDIDYSLLNASIFYATNKQRIRHNKKPFVFHSLLRDAALIQSTQMVKYHFFDHQNPKNAALKTLKDRLESAGGANKYLAVGENISEYFLLNYQAKDLFRIEKTDSKKVYISTKTGEQLRPHTYLSFGEAIVADWMTSPGHRANILEEKFTHLGCGSLQSTKPEDFPKAKATQVFGRLKQS